MAVDLRSSCWKGRAFTPQGVWERCQHATQQTHGLLGRGELHETLQKLQGTRRLSSTGAAGAQQAGKQATQTAQQAVRSAHAGGKGAASAAYRSLPQQVSSPSHPHLPWSYTILARQHT
jgi:ABC-type transporter Mla subunit MlaD